MVNFMGQKPKEPVISKYKARENHQGPPAINNEKIKIPKKILFIR
jgi:hypothetical protein